MLCPKKVRLGDRSIEKRVRNPGKMHYYWQNCFLEGVKSPKKKTAKCLPKSANIEAIYEALEGGQMSSKAETPANTMVTLWPRSFADFGPTTL